MTASNNPARIFITGGSSGLGAALARHYAAPGVTLFLHGRNQQRLEDVAQSCRAKGAAVQCLPGDVTDAPGITHAIESCGAIDILFANAGVSAGSGQLGETAAQAAQLFDTNITGVLHTIHAALPAMLEKKSGQIAVISSLAGVRGLPSCPAYSASKACVRAYGEALRGWLSPRGIRVSVVCPGYIKTPMTDGNDFPMPFLMSGEKAAAIIARGLAKNRPRIAFPLIMFLPLWWLSCLPPRLTDWFFARLPAKPSL